MIGGYIIIYTSWLTTFSYRPSKDLIEGGEMFEHLAANGAYSEQRAARLARETASALAFLHGIGLVHADLKPGEFEIDVLMNVAPSDEVSYHNLLQKILCSVLR